MSNASLANQLSTASLQLLLGSVDLQLPALRDSEPDNVPETVLARSLHHVAAALVNVIGLKRKADQAAQPNKRRRTSVSNSLMLQEPTSSSTPKSPLGEPSTSSSTSSSSSTSKAEAQTTTTATTATTASTTADDDGVTRDVERINEVLTALEETKQKEVELMATLEQLRGAAVPLTQFSKNHPHCGLDSFERFVSTHCVEPEELMIHPYVHSLREYFIYPALTFNGVLHKNLDNLAGNRILILARTNKATRQVPVACSVCSRVRNPTRAVLAANRPSKKGLVCRGCQHLLSSMIAIYEELYTISEDYEKEMQLATQFAHIGQLTTRIQQCHAYCQRSTT